MLNRIFSVIVIAVLVLAIVAAGLLFYANSVDHRRPRFSTFEAGLPSSIGQTPSSAQEPASPAGTQEPGKAQPAPEKTSAVAKAEKAASPPLSATPPPVLTMPPLDQRADTILEYAVASLPGWKARIVAHDSAYKSATVRATSPTGKLSLDIDVHWDKELGDFSVVNAQAAGTAKTVATVPKGIIMALDSNPKFKKLPLRKVSMKRLTSDDATILVQSDIKKWQVYLKLKGGHWRLIKAREL